MAVGMCGPTRRQGAARRWRKDDRDRDDRATDDGEKGSGTAGRACRRHNESRAGMWLLCAAELRWLWRELVAGVLDQCHLAGALDGERDLTLVLAAVAGLTSLADPPTIIDELPKQVKVLVVDGASRSGIRAMDALLLPPSPWALAPPSSGSAFVCHLHLASLSTCACLSNRV